MRKRTILFLLSVLLLAGCQKEPQAGIRPETGATVYGKVSCGLEGLKGVVVSDGIDVTVTGDDGVYQLKSKKKNGYVFISIPSGYDVLTTGVIPQFYKYLKYGSAAAERVDFSLLKADQSEYTVLYFGDIHLAGRNFCHDVDQFREFASDVKQYSKGKKTYAITLGDMSWDVYWSSGFDLTKYLSEMNSTLLGLPVFHTMGNHDNDCTQSGDFEGAGAFRSSIGPNWYSFNIGPVHFVVLDDISYVNDPVGDRNFSAKISDEELSWLVKDLSFISYDTPVVLVSHVPFYRQDGSDYIRNVDQVLSVLKYFKNVEVVSGHTHVIVNTDKCQENNVFERNSGAVCGAWWVSGGNYPGLLLCSDGAPGGYRVMTVDGDGISWLYKGTGRQDDFQMRCYDRNELLLDRRWVAATSSERQKEFADCVGEYSRPGKPNEVLINIWDYCDGWTLAVTEQPSGRQLPITRLDGAKDPLYLAVYEAYQLNNGYNVSYPCSVTNHIFKLTASSANSTLTITATDPYGHSYSETMTRPKPFSTESYLSITPEPSISLPSSYQTAN